MVLTARNRIAARPGDADRRDSRTAFAAVALQFCATFEMDGDVGDVALFAPPEPVSQASAGFLMGAASPFVRHCTAGKLAGALSPGVLLGALSL